MLELLAKAELKYESLLELLPGENCESLLELLPGENCESLLELLAVENCGSLLELPAGFAKLSYPTTARGSEPRSSATTVN